MIREDGKSTNQSLTNVQLILGIKVVVIKKCWYHGLETPDIIDRFGVRVHD